MDVDRLIIKLFSSLLFAFTCLFCFRFLLSFVSFDCSSIILTNGYIRDIAQHTFAVIVAFITGN